MIEIIEKKKPSPKDRQRAWTLFIREQAKYERKMATWLRKYFRDQKAAVLGKMKSADRVIYFGDDDSFQERKAGGLWKDFSGNLVFLFPNNFGLSILRGKQPDYTIKAISDWMFPFASWNKRLQEEG